MTFQRRRKPAVRVRIPSMNMNRRRITDIHVRRALQAVASSTTQDTIAQSLKAKLMTEVAERPLTNQ